jgi:spore coat-associated protein N
MKLGISPAVAGRFSSKVVKIAIFATAAIGGTALASSSVFASLNAEGHNVAAHSVSTGTLKLTHAASGQAGLTGVFSTAITGMAPGDTVNRYIDVTQGGTLDGAALTLKVADAAATTLTTDATNGLQITVSQCSVAFTATTGACTGTTTTALATISANGLLSAQSLSGISTTAGAVAHLKIALALPAGSELTSNGVLPVGTVQGVTSTLTWTFFETQRTATNTNS